MIAAIRHYTFQDYLSVEGAGAVRHEFLSGEIFAMAPGTAEHAALASAVVGLLGVRLKGRRCRLYGADLRILIPATGLATYADAAVILGEPIRDPESPTHMTNPSVIVEVLGPATQAYDRGEKRKHYQYLASLGDYVLVAQDRREIDVYTRAGADGWRRSIYGPGQTVDLPSIDVEFDVDELYTAAGVR
jgi:Uma2 family endonuclease